MDTIRTTPKRAIASRLLGHLHISIGPNCIPRDEATGAGEDIHKPARILWRQGVFAAACALHNWVINDMPDIGPVGGVRSHTLHNELGESRREGREVDDTEVVGAQCLPWRSAIRYTDIGRNFEDNKAKAEDVRCHDEDSTKHLGGHVHPVTLALELLPVRLRRNDST